MHCSSRLEASLFYFTIRSGLFGSFESVPSRYEMTASKSEVVVRKTPNRLPTKTSSKHTNRNADIFGTLVPSRSRIPAFRFFNARKIAAERDVEWFKNMETVEEEKTHGLRKFELEQKKEDIVVSEPLSVSKAMARKAKKEKMRMAAYQKLYGDDCNKSKVIIECARKEFNHYDGMRYPSSSIPLASQYWVKNKYKNDWFEIRRSGKKDFFNEGGPCDWSNFSALLHPSVLRNISDCGFRRPTDIQVRSLMAFSNEKHLIIAAETGSGKTLAYAAPLISSLSKDKGMKALILVNSRYLQNQIYHTCCDLAKGTSVCILKADDEAGSALNSDWNLLISAPSSVLPFLEGVEPSKIEYVLIDEADSLFDDCHMKKIADILSMVDLRFDKRKGNECGTRLLVISATVPSYLEEAIEMFVSSENTSIIRSKHLHNISPHIIQKFIRVRERDKITLTEEMLKADSESKSGQTLIFCKDPKTAFFVSSVLQSDGYENVYFKDSEKTVDRLIDFTDGKQKVLVASSLASRGLDLPFLRHVINYDCPRTLIEYIHRVGRVGRVGSCLKGKVTTLVRNAEEVELTNTIEYAVRFERTIIT